MQALCLYACFVLGTTDPLPPGVDPRLSLVLVPSPVELRGVIAQFPAELADRFRCAGPASGAGSRRG